MRLRNLLVNNWITCCVRQMDRTQCTFSFSKMCLANVFICLWWMGVENECTESGWNRIRTNQTELPFIYGIFGRILDTLRSALWIQRWNVCDTNCACVVGNISPNANRRWNRHRFRIDEYVVCECDARSRERKTQRTIFMNSDSSHWVRARDPNCRAKNATAKWFMHKTATAAAAASANRKCQWPVNQ